MFTAPDGKSYRPSMFLTLTCDSYGKVRDDGTPADPSTYDYTRGASPTVVRALAKHLGPAEGRLLLDVGGGTGNYAQVFQARGFRVLVVDPEFEMIVHAARKVGPGRSAVADARSLPLPDASVDLG